MLDEKKFNDSLRFVSRHYRAGAFSRGEAWQRLGIATGHITWRISRTAAAVTAAVVLTASACMLKWGLPAFDSKPATETTTSAPAHVTATPAQSHKIEFKDATLAEVVVEIERVYAVRVADVPEGTYRLTLSYEGTAADLIETINELLGTRMHIEPCENH